MYTDEFSYETWTLIQYQEQYHDWKDQLSKKVKYIIDCKKNPPDNLNFQYDLAIITALATPELRAVLDLPANWKEEEHPNDPSSTYYKGVFTTGTKTLTVVAACSAQMGMTAATVLSMKMIEKFKPKYLVMVGIAAGIKNKGNFGDILIADYSWDYGSGKNKYDESKGAAVLEPDPRPVTIDPELFKISGLLLR